MSILKVLFCMIFYLEYLSGRLAKNLRNWILLLVNSRCCLLVWNSLNENEMEQVQPVSLFISPK